ncbi:MAG: hypothetical protein A2Z34_00325 [Planctomycetes bacterium RBG_16_59_8]|nr:MAG: hypothetical protein A2Z34_00325 [Planctomycetes bacterium RBG_16_59_8]
MDRIEAALSRCTHFLAVGTSGVVYPAAGFLHVAKLSGATTHGINLDLPENSRLFARFHRGKAGELLPLWDASLEVADMPS